MIWIIGFLTFVLVVDCLLLGLLVLIQLPKKEAGLGTAFGGGTTDALFGAGTGNALTKMTKYSTVVFFVLTLTLSVLNAHQSKAQRIRFSETLDAIPAEVPPPPAMPTNAAPAPVEPEAATPEATAPEAATPEAATPEAGTPEATAPEAAPPAEPEP